MLGYLKSSFLEGIIKNFILFTWNLESFINLISTHCCKKSGSFGLPFCNDVRYHKNGQQKRPRISATLVRFTVLLSIKYEQSLLDFRVRVIHAIITIFAVYSLRQKNNDTNEYLKMKNIESFILVLISN